MAENQRRREGQRGGGQSQGRGQREEWGRGREQGGYGEEYGRGRESYGESSYGQGEESDWFGGESQGSYQHHDSGDWSDRGGGDPYSGRTGSGAFGYAYGRPSYGSGGQRSGQQYGGGYGGGGQQYGGGYGGGGQQYGGGYGGGGQQYGGGGQSGYSAGGYPSGGRGAGRQSYGSGQYGSPASSGYGGYSGGSSGGYGQGQGQGERGMWDRASDEVASWFGDRGAEQRRDMDQHRGRGPKNYTRSDDRIREDVCDRLSDDPMVDASEIEVKVDDGEVTLSGTVNSREARRRAEDCVESISGVKHVQNNTRLQSSSQSGSDLSVGTGSSGSSSGSSTSAIGSSSGKSASK